jgi:hypothetical protein
MDKLLRRIFTKVKARVIFTSSEDILTPLELFNKIQDDLANCSSLSDTLKLISSSSAGFMHFDRPIETFSKSDLLKMDGASGTNAGYVFVDAATERIESFVHVPKIISGHTVLRKVRTSTARLQVEIDEDGEECHYIEYDLVDQQGNVLYCFTEYVDVSE